MNEHEKQTTHIESQPNKLDHVTLAGIEAALGQRATLESVDLSGEPMEDVITEVPGVPAPEASMQTEAEDRMVATNETTPTESRYGEQTARRLDVPERNTPVVKREMAKIPGRSEYKSQVESHADFGRAVSGNVRQPDEEK